jgi:sulfide:quinone oxidoreductase
VSAPHVLVLGAGFGGLEVAKRLSEAGGVDVTLVDQADGFTFGFSKLEVLFRGSSATEVRLPYRDLSMPGVRFRQERITAIDPAARAVVTDAGTYEADALVVALGADYDHAATPGFVEDGFEFYSVAGAARLHERLLSLTGGDIVLAILGVPFKCPPAPYEAALLLHDHLVERGIRDACRIEVITPMDSPIPVSPTANTFILSALTERQIAYTPGHRVRELDPVAHVARMRDEDRPYDLLIGVPVHRAPAVVAESGLTEGGNDGWVKVDRHTLATPYDGVWALGDCADAPVPRAGVFAESAAAVVAEGVLARLHGGGDVRPYEGTGACYLEMGDGRVGKVEANFLGGPAPTAPFVGPTRELAADKERFAATRRERWFGGG